MLSAILVNTLLCSYCVLGVDTDAAAILGSEQDLNPNPILVVDTHGFAGEKIRSLAISHDAQWLAAAGNKEIRIWHIPTQRMHAVLRGNRDPEGFPVGNVHEVTFSPDGEYLLVGIADNTPNGSTRVYKFSDLSRLHLLLPGHLGCTKQLAIASSGKRFATYGCGEVIVRVRDLSKLEDDAIYDNRLRADEFDNDEYVLKTATTVGEIQSSSRSYFFFFNDDQNIAHYDHGEVRVLNADGRPVRRDKWPSAFQDFLAADINVQTLFRDRWFEPSLQRSISKGRKFLTFVGGAARNGSDDIFAIAVFDPKRRAPIGIYRKHNLLPVAVTICPNPRHDLVASADQFGEIHLWRVGSAEPESRFLPRTRPIWGAALSDASDGIVFADTTYRHPRFNVNHYGPRQHKLLFDRKVIVPTEPLPDDPSEITLVIPDRGEHRLHWKCVPTRAGMRELLESVDNKGQARDWNVGGGEEAPTAMAAAPTTEDSRSVLVGTRSGSLIDGSFVRNPVTTSEVSVAGQVTPLRKLVGHTGMVTSISVSKDKRWIVSSSLDGTVRIYTAAAKIAGDFPGDLDVRREGNHVLGIGDLSRHAGIRVGDRLLTFQGRPYYERLRGIAAGEFKKGGLVDVEVVRDGKSVMIQDVPLDAASQIVEPSLSILFLKAGDWIAWTPQGMYDCSSNAEQYLGWHLNQGRKEPAQFLSISAFRKQLYRPGLISEVLSTGSDVKLAAKNSPQAPPAPVAEPDLRERQKFDASRPPRIEFVEPRVGRETSQSSLTVNFKVIAREGQEETDIRVLVNGQPIPMPPLRGDSTRLEGFSHSSYRQEVALEEGINEVTVRAANAHGQVESAPLRIVYDVPGKAVPGKARLFVLSIGISEFSDASVNLKYAHKDAEDFAQLWEGQRGKFYSQIETRLITNERATRDGVKDGLDWMSEQARARDDVALIFIAGHATFDHFHRWHLLTHDYAGPKSLGKTSITHAELKDWFENTLAAKAVLFIDTCHAAGAFSTRGLGPRLPNPWQGYGRLVLAGSTVTEEAQERSTWQNGAFTKALLKAAGDPEADSRKFADGMLSFTELAQYVTQEVGTLTDGAQTPNATIPGNVGTVNLLKLP